MHLKRSVLAGAIVLASLVGARLASAYICPGGTTDYVTNCLGLDRGTPCIRTSTGTGCCTPGTCRSDVCDIAAQTACHDGEPICTIDSCTTAGGGNNDPICTYTPVAAGTSCNTDGNLCTLDTCNSSGVCVVGPNKDCSSTPLSEPQCQAPACNPNNGNCYAAAANEGKHCNDGKDCSYGESCNNGGCGAGAGAGSPRANHTVCFDGDFCHPGECDGTHFGCSNRQAKNVGDSCDINECGNSTCQLQGNNLNCVTNSCLDNTNPCLVCGPNAKCNPAAGTGGSTACGCVVGAFPYSPPN